MYYKIFITFKYFSARAAFMKNKVFCHARLETSFTLALYL